MSGDDGLSAAPRATGNRPAPSAPGPSDPGPSDPGPARPQSLAERRAQTLERLRTEGQDDAHPTRRPAPRPETGPEAAQDATPADRVTPMRPTPGAESNAEDRQAQQPAPSSDTRSTQGPETQAAQPLHPRSLPPRGAGMPPHDQQPPARDGEVSAPGEMTADEDLDAIRKEGLTGRQLRMARRVAQKHGLAPTSDFDAVRLLRARGIDPFKRANMLEVLPQNSSKALAPTGDDGAALPQTVPAGQGRSCQPPRARPRRHRAACRNAASARSWRSSATSRAGAAARRCNF